MDKVRSADGTMIAYEKTGSGPSLVLVPGGGANDHRRWDACRGSALFFCQATPACICREK